MHITFQGAVVSMPDIQLLQEHEMRAFVDGKSTPLEQLYNTMQNRFRLLLLLLIRGAAARPGDSFTRILRVLACSCQNPRFYYLV